MKEIWKISTISVFVGFQQGFAQSGIITSSDNCVTAINASSTVIPQADLSTGIWTAINAYWESPLIYRSRRFPDNGTGAFPFNDYGELMIQGTSQGRLYNKGISFFDVEWI